jgi:hypothetical protein
VDKQFQTLESLIEALQERRVKQVELAGKVATTISPGGQQISFRGRVIVSADLGKGERAEYVEQVMPYVTHNDAPEVPVAKEQAAELHQAQLALARQLRAYRGEYEGVMDAARLGLAQRLQAADLSIAEPEE